MSYVATFYHALSNALILPLPDLIGPLDQFLWRKILVFSKFVKNTIVAMEQPISHLMQRGNTIQQSKNWSLHIILTPGANNVCRHGALNS